MASIRYPNKVFTGGGDSTGADFATGSVDYVKFEAIKPYQDPNSNTQTSTSAGVVYLYMPSQLQVNYAASYNSVAIGAAGVAAAQALKSSSSLDLASAIQGYAQSAGPEFAFSTVATGLAGIKDLTGTGGANLTASQLSALSQGKIFNPYMEQIFEAPGFRDHNFSFKMIARDKKEATDIKKIIDFFKTNMLPALSGYTDSEAKSAGQTQDEAKAGQAAKDAKGNAKPAAAASNTALFENYLKTPGVANNRWLSVPNKFDISFQRFPGFVSGAISSNDNQVNGLYKFKRCVLKSCQVNYTPDGQYTAFASSTGISDLIVPAVQIDLSFSETEIITSIDAAAGY
jgi:hypothetical protein